MSRVETVLSVELHGEYRWALRIKLTKAWERKVSLGARGRRSFLAGRFCWPGATEAEPGIRTFRTRQEAREARAEMTGWAPDEERPRRWLVQPIQVWISIQSHRPQGEDLFSP